MQHVDIYSDGSSRGNPGPGGYGTILRYIDVSGLPHTKELSQGFSNTTNNRMELMGVIAGFEALTKPCEVSVYTDSQYIVNAFNSHWIDNWQRNNWKNAQKKPVKNPDLWNKLLQAMHGHKVSFFWIKGHAGNKENERCDVLATTAADAIRKIDDQGFIAP